MKFLRMRPGYGEQLIAEGDVEVGEDEQMLVEEFRRQLEQGMWAAIPVENARAGGRPRWCGRSRTSRAPPIGSSSSRAPRAERSKQRAVTVALCATAIVVIALLWEVMLPYVDRRMERRRARRAARAAGDVTRTTRAASAAPSSAPASSCVPA